MAICITLSPADHPGNNFISNDVEIRRIGNSPAILEKEISAGLYPIITDYPCDIR